MNRILIFGDSILKGVYYSGEEGRHRLWGGRLSELKEAGWEVQNCAVMGATVTSGEALLKRKLPADVRDDTVVFEYGGNDCDFHWRDISDNPAGEFFPNTPADVFARGYASMVNHVRSLGARVFLCNLVPLCASRYADWISRNLSKENILSWLGDESMLYRWQESYSRTAERIADETGSTLIDVRTPFLTSHRYTDLMCPDGIHPTPEGHRLIDREIVRSVTQ